MRTRRKEMRREEANKEGTRKDTSTSKIIKIMISKKNFIQKGK